MRKLLIAILITALALSLSGCFDTGEENYLLGESFDPVIYEPETYERFENETLGIIIEYPSGAERVGNFENDGYITFVKEDIRVEIHTPVEFEEGDERTEEQHAISDLGLKPTEESGNTKYGKTSGYRIITRDEESGDTRVDFVVKGVSAFYHFAYTCNNPRFVEQDAVFLAVAESIRIDDGVYDELNRIETRYSVLFQYATSMQYVTDANYASHCLSSFDLHNDDHYKNDAITTFESIREEIDKIIVYDRKGDTLYDDMWQEVVEGAKQISSLCDAAIEAINQGNIEEAKHIATSGFSYELSNDASAMLSVINEEISEY